MTTEHGEYYVEELLDVNLLSFLNSKCVQVVQLASMLLLAMYGTAKMDWAST